MLVAEFKEKRDFLLKMAREFYQDYREHSQIQQALVDTEESLVMGERCTPKQAYEITEAILGQRIPKLMLIDNPSGRNCGLIFTRGSREKGTYGEDDFIDEESEGESIYPDDMTVDELVAKLRLVAEWLEEAQDNEHFDYVYFDRGE